MKSPTGWVGTLCLTAALGALGCGEGGGSARVEVERDTIGDTLVVRTLAGSVWGAQSVLEPEVRIGVFEGEDEYMFGQVVSIAVAPDGSIYAMDRQVPALRKYDAEGRHVATFGREGGGPGEYKSPDGGLAVLPDGRVALRDPGNARIQVYSSTGEPLDTWSLRGGFNTSNPMIVDTAGRLYTLVLLDAEASVMEWRMGMAALDGRTGEGVDTIPAPDWDYDEPRLVASRTSEGGTSTSVNGVPFSPSSEWAFSPLGYMVGGVSTRYAIDQFLPDGRVLRVERVADLVPVDAAEKANQEEQARWNMRRTQPDWKWNGPAIPDRKPPFEGLNVGLDGRIWVQVPQPGERIPDGEIDVPDAPDARPPTRWRSRVAYDVFEPDGTYLGLVRAPRGFGLWPNPVFDGDRVWATLRDELDVQYLVRFVVSRSSAEGRAE